MQVLPDLIDRGVSLFILVIGIGIVAVQTALATAAAGRSAAKPSHPFRWAVIVGVYLTVWLGLAILFGDTLNFRWSADRQLRLPLALLLAFGPMLGAIGALFAFRGLQRLNAAMPPHWLIWAQTYRMAGVMFLYPFLYYGIVPAGFAVPAAIGDFVTGLLAPVVARAVAERRPHAWRWAVAWNAFGIFDLIVAPAAALLTQAQVLGLYPLSLVPLFIGPPLGILTHVFSLRNLYSTLSAVNVSSTLQRGERHAGPLKEAARTI